VGLFSLLIANPLLFLLLVIPLLFSVIAHEVAHGLVALWFGDRTAQSRGRLTLDPRKHLDPLGSLMVFLVGFGWARPVPVNYGSLRPFRTGLVCVALAGVTVNILIAAAAAAFLKAGLFASSETIQTAFLITVKINVILAALNLIPIPPLDGSKVILGFLPRELQVAFMKFEFVGYFVLIVLLATGYLSFLIRLMENVIYGILSVMF